MIQFDVGIKMQIIINVYVLQKKKMQAFLSV